MGLSWSGCWRSKSKSIDNRRRRGLMLVLAYAARFFGDELRGVADPTRVCYASQADHPAIFNALVLHAARVCDLKSAHRGFLTAQQKGSGYKKQPGQPIRRLR
jgi:hypothetical protein